MPPGIPRCLVVPLPEDQVALQIAGRERLRWHHGTYTPRPFFYPLIGPSGSPLTRMGHPGAPDHDHHRSIWFAHAKVSGVNFWSDAGPARIRQKQWLAYQDGDTEARFAVRLGWFDGHDPQELMEQQLIVAVRPLDHEELWIEFQMTFQPRAASIELQKTNFGFLAVRVAKNLSAHFGGGSITAADGSVGEAKIFAKPFPWVDYSGPVPGGQIEGITYFDHPSNPGHPVSWHVRSDGWMGAGVCLREGITVEKTKPLQLRYLLHVHRDAVQIDRANAIGKEFALLTKYQLIPAKQAHESYRIERASS